MPRLLPIRRATLRLLPLLPLQTPKLLPPLPSFPDGLHSLFIVLFSAFSGAEDLVLGKETVGFVLAYVALGRFEGCELAFGR